MAKQHEAPIRDLAESGHNVNPERMMNLVYDYDWHESPLGDMTEWDPVLRTTTNICVHAKSPMLLLWGRDMIQIYNDPYRDIIGLKHNSIGKKVSEVWSSIWSDIGPLLQSVFDNGEAVKKENTK